MLRRNQIRSELEGVKAPKGSMNDVVQRCGAQYRPWGPSSSERGIPHWLSRVESVNG
jgi:hypothetical protein